MNQKQIANWATSILSKTWLYKTDEGYVLPSDVRWAWELTSLDDNEDLIPSLLFTTPKKAIYRVAYSTGVVDVSVPISGLGIVNWPEDI
jgi:hypothetical protein